jgi:cell wall-associated NlpC family hydrolase
MQPAALFLAALLAVPAPPAAAVEDVQQPDTVSALPAASAPAAAPDRASEVVLTAMNFLGVRYRRGGSSEAGFDCSGFTRHIVETSLGLVLPRRADEQASAPGLVTIRRDDLRPGDLVFFNTLKRTFSHVGIYLGDGRFIHAPRPGGAVRIEDMGYPYWRKRYTGARRLETPGAASPPVHAGASTQAE